MKKTRAKQVCDLCKKRKIKCDREITIPCSPCFKKGNDCVLSVTTKKRGRKAGRTDLVWKYHFHPSHPSSAVPSQRPNKTPLRPFGYAHLVTPTLVGDCVTVSLNALQTQWPSFSFHYDTGTSVAIWIELNNGVDFCTISSWRKLVNYYKHALVYSTGSYILGMNCEPFDKFIRRVCDNYFEDTSSIASEEVSDVAAALLIKGFYDHIKEDVCSKTQSYRILNTLIATKAHMIDTMTIHRVIANGILSKKQKPMEAVRDCHALADSKHIKDPTSEVLLSLIVMTQLLNYTPRKGWNLYIPLCKMDVEQMTINLTRVETFLYYRPQTDWNQMLLMFVFILRSGLFATNDLIEEAKVWISKAIDQSNTFKVTTLNTQGPSPFGGIQVLFTMLLEDICQKCNIPELIEGAQQVMHHLGIYLPKRNYPHKEVNESVKIAIKVPQRDFITNYNTENISAGDKGSGDSILNTETHSDLTATATITNTTSLPVISNATAEVATTPAMNTTGRVTHNTTITKTLTNRNTNERMTEGVPIVKLGTMQQQTHTWTGVQEIPTSLSLPELQPRTPQHHPSPLNHTQFQDQQYQTQLHQDQLYEAQLHSPQCPYQQQSQIPSTPSYPYRQQILQSHPVQDSFQHEFYPSQQPDPPTIDSSIDNMLGSTPYPPLCNTYYHPSIGLPHSYPEEELQPETYRILSSLDEVYNKFVVKNV